MRRHVTRIRKHKKRHTQKRRFKKQAGGGKLSIIPFNGISETHFNVGTVMSDITSHWEISLVSGHGILMPGHYGTVPRKTYVIFNSPSGCGAFANVIPYPEIFIGPAGFYLSRLTADIKRGWERIQKIEKGEALTAEENSDFLFKTLAPKERAALLECEEGGAAAAAGNLPKVYPAEFFTGSRSTAAVCIKDSRYTAKTIYGPGEKFPNMTITFQNYPGESLLMGVYKPPFSLDAFNTLNSNHDQLKTLDSSEREEKTHENDATLFGEGGITKNLRPDLLFKTETLDKIVDAIPVNERKPYRLIIVNSCRGIPEMANRNRMTRLMRAESINSTGHGLVWTAPAEEEPTGAGGGAAAGAPTRT